MIDHSTPITGHAVLQVDPKKFRMLSNWSRAYSIRDILVELRKQMSMKENMKLPQPTEGSTYPPLKDDYAEYH